MWDNIINFYQQTAQSPREGEMWDKMRHHCRNMPTLIDEIRNHYHLQKCHPRIDGIQLALVNLRTYRVARILIDYDDIVEITLVDGDEVMVDAKYTVIQTIMSDALKVLEDELIDN